MHANVSEFDEECQKEIGKQSVYSSVGNCYFRFAEFEDIKGQME